MNFRKTRDFRFIPLAMLVSIFLIYDVLGIQEVPIPGGSENQLQPLSLIGVLVSEDPSSSMALMHDKGTGKTLMLTVGESIGDMKLIHVLGDGVFLKKGVRIYWIFMGNGTRLEADQKIARIPRRVEETDPAYDPGRSRRVNNDPQVREFVRSEVQARVNREWPMIIKETEVGPNYVDGKMSGLRVVRLPGTSIAPEIGIYKDDVIKEVNGVKLDSLSALVSLHSQIFVEDRFDVLIERDKKLVRQVYTLR
jgi:type II secretory pathway component PulC